MFSNIIAIRRFSWGVDEVNALQRREDVANVQTDGHDAVGQGSSADPRFPMDRTYYATLCIHEFICMYINRHYEFSTSLLLFLVLSNAKLYPKFYLRML